MTRNTKIALGCGGGGCLGLILLVIVCVVLVVTGIVPAPGLYNPNRNSNYSYNSNRNTNYNSNLNSNANRNSNSNTSSSSSMMSDDDKHKLVQAAGRANDSEMLKKVLRKLGFITDTGVSDDYAQFLKDHPAWGLRNREFVRSVNTPEAARAYVNAHIDD
jgi:hypothetical protein